MKKFLLLALCVVAGMSANAQTIVNEAVTEVGDKWTWINEAPVTGKDYVVVNSMQLKDNDIVRAIHTNDSKALATSFEEAAVFTVQYSEKTWTHSAYQYIDMNGGYDVRLEHTEVTVDGKTYDGYALNFKLLGFTNYIYCSGEKWGWSPTESVYSNNYVWSFFSKEQRSSYTDYRTVQAAVDALNGVYDVLDDEQLALVEQLNNVPEGDITYGDYDGYNTKEYADLINDLLDKLVGKVHTEAVLAAKAGKYGTFIAPYDCNLSDVTEGDVTVYKVTGYATDDTHAIYTEEIKDVIPAGQPVLVYSTSGVSHTFTGKLTASPYNGGALKGTYKDMTVTEGNYVLQTKTSGQQFYLVGKNSVTLGKNRCYLLITAPAGTASVKLNVTSAEETGINCVSNASSTTEYFTLDGVKTSAPKKGVNIVKMNDGSVKKIIIK